MSLDMTTYESVCYVHCHFCNTILVVTVPCISSLDVVTIRCGHCTNFLYVNMGALQHTVHLQGLQKQNSPSFQDSTSIKDFGSSSKCNKVSMLGSSNHDQPRSVLTTPVTPQKRQRVPSAYNRFIKEEIQRIKANNPDISHKEAFSTAAKNWAHFPHMQFGLTINNAAAAAAAGGTNKIGETNI